MFFGLKSIKSFKRLIGFLLYTEYSKVGSGDLNAKIFKLIEEELHFDCPNCNHTGKVEKADCILFFETDLLLCPKCFSDS